MEKKKDEKEHFSFQTDIWFHKILKKKNEEKNNISQCSRQPNRQERMLLQNLHIHVLLRGHGIYPHLQHFSNKIFKIILYIRVFIV